MTIVEWLDMQEFPIEINSQILQMWEIFLMDIQSQEVQSTLRHQLLCIKFLFVFLFSLGVRKRCLDSIEDKIQTRVTKKQIIQSKNTIQGEGYFTS